MNRFTVLSTEDTQHLQDTENLNPFGVGLHQIKSKTIDKTSLTPDTCLLCYLKSISFLTHSWVYFSSTLLDLMFCRAAPKADPCTHFITISFWAVSQSMAGFPTVEAHLDTVKIVVVFFFSIPTRFCMTIKIDKCNTSL